MSATPYREIEIKYSAADIETLALLPSALQDLGVRAGAPRRRVIRDLYLDTPDFWFYRAGVACRLRIETGRVELCLKTLTPPADDIADRRELVELLPRHPALPLRRLPGRLIARKIQPFIARPVIRKLCEIRQQRAVYAALLSAHGERVLISADRVQAAEANTALHIIEIELRKGQPAGLIKFGRKLKARLNLGSSAPSKFESAVRAAGVRLPAPPEPIPVLKPDDRLDNAIFLILRTHFNLALWNRPGVLLGLDPEKVHEMRVAARRLAAALQIFSFVLPARAVDEFRCELKWLTSQLGRVRDLDVFVAHLIEARADVPTSERAALEALLARVRRNAGMERRRMIAAVRSPRFVRFTGAFNRFLAAGPTAGSARRLAAMPLMAAAPEMVCKSYKKAVRSGRSIHPRSPALDLHCFRRRCRKLRYLGEYFRDLSGAPMRRLVRRAKACQDALGRLQDAVVAQSTLAYFCAERLTPREAVHYAALMACLQALFHKQARHGRNDFKRAWMRFGKPKGLKKTLRRLAKKSARADARSSRR